ncbi:MAG: crossover junction endodeoxyribonuclease RuvC [Dehalococcoidales bacterium]|nr:crossover junction endodeoxyribonuclease RuvC [Dehalococcoidales bacterium]
MKILGIDPGTLVMGYGVVESQDDAITLVDYGALITPPRSPIGERLSFLYRKLEEIIAKYQPDAVAVEQPFVAKNAQSALAIGKAQAVAILAGANQGLPTYEYTPAQIKQSVSNYGASSKEQIQEMVRLQLGLSEIPRPSDAADALAVALCHLSQIHLSNLLARQEQGEPKQGKGSKYPVRG